MAIATIGMMTYSFNRSITAGEIDVAGIVRVCAELGIDAIDLTERHWGDPEQDIPATAAALEETGLTVACCNTALDLVTRGGEAKAEREEALCALFDKLSQVKCPCVMLGSPTNDQGPEDWRREFGIGLGESVPIAEDYGVTVTFENRGGPAGEYIGTVEHAREIMAAAGDERLKFTFDVGNFRYVGKDWDAAFDELADTIAHVHLKDVVPKGESFGMVPLGEGEVDNGPTIRKLVARGYDGCISIECGGVGTDKEDAAKSVAFVKGVLAG